MTATAAKPSVLFVCVHNAGRSQMAAGYLTAPRPAAQIEVRSAGSVPGDQVNPVAVAGHGRGRHRHLHPDGRKCCHCSASKASDVVITMGCGDACPVFPGKRYEDWELEDPAGQGHRNRPPRPRRHPRPYPGTAGPAAPGGGLSR